MGLEGTNIFDGGDVEEHFDFSQIKIDSLGFKIVTVAMLKNMLSFTQ